MAGVDISKIRGGDFAKAYTEKEIKSLCGTVRILKLSKAQVRAFQDKAAAVADDDESDVNADELVGELMIASCVEFQDGDEWAGLTEAEASDVLSDLPLDAYQELSEAVLKANGLSEEVAKETRENFPDGAAGSEASAEGSD